MGAWKTSNELSVALDMLQRSTMHYESSMWQGKYKQVPAGPS